MPFENQHHYHLYQQRLMRRQQHSTEQWQRRAMAGDESLSPRIQAPYGTHPFEDDRSMPSKAFGGSVTQIAAGVVTPRDEPQTLTGTSLNSARAPRGMSSSLMTAGLSALGSKSAPEPFKSLEKKKVIPEDLSINDLPCSPKDTQLKVRDLTTDGRALGFVYPAVKGHERRPILDASDLPPLEDRLSMAALRAQAYTNTRGVI